jgi:D-3-phosphoglycerate dehydrogenase
VKRFKILITDHLAEEGYQILNADSAVDYELRAGIKNSELKLILKEYDAIITRSGTTVDKELLSDTGRLRIIGRAGVGLDNVDIEEASKKGIIVMNAPTGNTLAAVELTMGLILSAARKIPAADFHTRNGEWDRKRFLGIQLYGKALGIVGLGRIGRNVAVRASAFGMKVFAYDPYIKTEAAESIGVSLFNTLDELLAYADIITLHTPLTTETRHIITRERLAAMKDGAIFINCARGGLVEENALVEALRSGKLFSAATDVYEEEPPVYSVLKSIDNLFLTPHIGANTEEGQKGVAVIICEQVLNALHGRAYQFAVNTPFERNRLSSDMQRFFDVSERLGRLAGQLTNGRVQELRLVMAGKRFNDSFVEHTFDSPFNYQPFTFAAIKGFLEFFVHEAVSFINAPYFAKDRGIVVTETKVQEYNKMSDHVILTVKTDEEETIYTATVFSDGVGRIVGVGPFRLDLIPSGMYLYFRNVDTPGIVGYVGTLLGKHNINIANFELTRLSPNGEAISFVYVDEPITQAVLDEMSKYPGIIEVKFLKV